MCNNVARTASACVEVFANCLACKRKLMLSINKVDVDKVYLGVELCPYCSDNLKEIYEHRGRMEARDE
jgi:formate dehydrogenase maturation protein FdhE